MPVTPPEKQCEPRLTAERLSRVESSLQDLDWRLLHWLLRYPLQRAEDLVVGVARWTSRATVYRHLQVLEASGLVESVLPKTPGEGKRVYHLSNLGLHVLARHLERSADELARAWQADDAGLLRMLPRLATLLPIQDVVNGLVMGAAEAMTNQGRRPQLVRWTWQRDVTHRFQYRDQSMRLFVDGAMALCIRTRQTDGSSLDHWYGLLLLYTNLDDERLLCWRESPERWSSYQHMLPVFILAASPRRAEHWQHAVETSALKLRLEPLRGALACFSHERSLPVNPWRFAWRTLSTNCSCHLGDLLRAVPPAVFRPLLNVNESEVGPQHTRTPPKASSTSGPAEKSARLVVGNLARRAAHVARSNLEEREVTALLGLRLTPGHWSILRLLLAHPLFSDEELAALQGRKRKSLRSSLDTLRVLGCLESLSTSAGNRWHLRERGLRLISAANHLSLRNTATRPDDETSSILVQRGEGWLLQNIEHTAGIYGFFAVLAQTARRAPEQALCWWETGAACERRYRVGEYWHNLRPDALAEYRVGQRSLRFWLEWDRGTMNVRDLTVKFTSYAHYIASREWAREGSAMPSLLCVAPELAQERRIQRVAQSNLSSITGLVIWTTTAVLLHEQGPLAPIWSSGPPQPGQVAKTGSLPRCSVFEMISQEKEDDHTS